MEATLASNADAQLVLKLYELRREETMRKARAWMTSKFWPATIEEFLAVHQAMGGEENRYLRQVSSYWDMAATFVLHGALDADLFIECNSENFFLLAKFQDLMPEIRKNMPSFLLKTEMLTQKYGNARQKFEGMLKAVPKRRELSLAQAGKG
jgi:hypothetical protein